ncbi:MAG: hypothetical protein SFV18_18110 [Bryobacteraceae bacterium]|nr:hypothetical protein [Bryobacteraceae bacterium]
MIFPTAQETTLLLAVLYLLCLGSWANTYKLAGPKWRFELYYFDFAIGTLAAALIAAFTLGSMGPELSFLDNLAIAGKRQMAYAMAAGVVFNLANLLVVGSISISGMSVAFPVAMGLSMAIGVVVSYLGDKAGNTALLFGGVAMALSAIVFVSLAAMAAARFRGTAAEAAAPKGNIKSAKPRGGGKGVLVALIAGLLMAGVYPLLGMARAGGSEIGLGPYALAVFAAIGIFFSTIIFDLYFINLPIEGPPIELGDYIKGNFTHHVLGFLGGAIWLAGSLTHWITSSVPSEIGIGAARGSAFIHGAMVLAMLWGLLVWREFRGAGGAANLYMAIGLLLTIAAAAMVSFAPGL